MNKKGFTLIELLAVIIILSILMIIAIPAVTRYINDSRKSAYIDSAKEIIGAARNMVNDDLKLFDTDTTYYIDNECISTENDLKSPYGEFEKAYVVVTYSGTNYDYYWTSIDETGTGVPKITRLDKLNEDSIKSDLKVEDIPKKLGIDGRNKYMIIDKTTSCSKGELLEVTDVVNGETGEIIDLVEYPEGKNKSTVELEDIVKIGNEEFIVIGKDDGKITLFAKYNLKLGIIATCNNIVRGTISPTSAGYGLQSSRARGAVGTGFDESYGAVAFSDSAYWIGKVGIGEGYVYQGKSYSEQCIKSSCANVFDSNSSLYQPLMNYMNYLRDQGVRVKSIRIPSYSDIIKFYDTASSEARSIINYTQFWLATPVSNSNGSSIYWQFGVVGYISYNHNMALGARPVIVI